MTERAGALNRKLFRLMNGEWSAPALAGPVGFIFPWLTPAVLRALSDLSCARSRFENRRSSTST